MMISGLHLRLYRTICDMTIREMAVKLNVHYSTLSRIEAGYVPVNSDIRRAYEELAPLALRVSIDNVVKQHNKMKGLK